MATMVYQRLTEYTRPLADEYQLSKGEVAKLEIVDQTVRIRSGCAWITVNGEDVIVRAGQNATLFPTHYAPVISPLGNRPLVYEIVT